MISFEELVPGAASVRYTIIDDKPHLSIRDLIMVICTKDGHDAAQIWRRLPESNRNELGAFCADFQFPGRGQSPQTVIQLQGALKVIMWLPGDMAKGLRSKACDLLTRVLAGDASLHAEIEGNAASAAPLNEFARASLPDSDAMRGIETSIKTLVATNAQQAEAMRIQASFVASMESSLTTFKSIQAAEKTNHEAERARLLADNAHERHLRHQADGRYGSGVREANKETRAQAAFWERQAHRGEQMVQEQRGWMRDMGERLAEMQAVTLRLAERLADRAV